MARIAVSNQVHVRNNMGQFIRDIEGAATRTIEDALEEGIAAAQAAAPVRTGRLRDSFVPLILSRTSGVFFNNAPYAMAQDQGAVRHFLPANVSFWWEKMGREWMPPDVYLRVTGHPGADPIDHPGNPATHFMDAGMRRIRARIHAIMQRNYPG
jgi:hypothetical protein